MPEKKKKTPALHLSEEQEQDIADWYRSHECLYNRRLKEYKLVDVKNRLFEEKASELNECTAKQLKVWIDSIRTTVGKITKKKSGQEAKELTDREKWILESFGYLRDHIKRIGPDKRRQGGQLDVNLPGPSKEPDDSDVEMVEEGEEDDREDEESTSSRATKEERGKKSTKGGPFKKCRKTVEELLGEVDQMSKVIQSKMDPQMDSASKCKRHFADMMFHETMQMDEQTWSDFQMQAFQLIMQFKQQRLRSRQVQVVPGTLAATYGHGGSSQMFATPAATPAAQSYTPAFNAQSYPTPARWCSPATTQSTTSSHGQPSTSPAGPSSFKASSSDFSFMQAVMSDDSSFLASAQAAVQ